MQWQKHAGGKKGVRSQKTSAYRKIDSVSSLSVVGCSVSLTRQVVLLRKHSIPAGLPLQALSTQARSSSVMCCIVTRLGHQEVMVLSAAQVALPRVPRSNNHLSRLVLLTATRQ